MSKTPKTKQLADFTNLISQPNHFAPQVDGVVNRLNKIITDELYYNGYATRNEANSEITQAQVEAELTTIRQDMGSLQEVEESIIRTFGAINLNNVAKYKTKVDNRIVMFAAFIGHSIFFANHTMFYTSEKEVRKALIREFRWKYKWIQAAGSFTQNTELSSAFKTITTAALQVRNPVGTAERPLATRVKHWFIDSLANILTKNPTFFINSAIAQGRITIQSYHMSLDGTGVFLPLSSVPVQEPVAETDTI